MTRALVAGAYAVLGALLVGTRLYGLDRGYWHDEIVTVADFVRAGPREILAGAYIPNNHELFSLLGWATSSVFGESEVALRLWSVVPFLLGVGLVTVWLHVRVSPLSGVFFLFFVTLSPLLLDLSRQARGYGIAFCAMGVLVVGALEARRSHATSAVAAAALAGVIGTWTLPVFGIAAVATLGSLLFDGALRRRVAVALGALVVATVAWYAPHLDDLVSSSRQGIGPDIGLAWLIAAPIDQVLIPALLWTDSVVVTPGLVWIPVIVVFLLLMGSSPLLRDRTTAFILVSSPVSTVLILWVTDTRFVPRFLSFLLVPMFILCATGIGAIVRRSPSRLVPSLAAIAVLAGLTALSVSTDAEVVRLPREAHKEAVAVIRTRGWESVPVFAYMARPRDLGFYLDGELRAGSRPSFAMSVCSQQEPVVLVVQPWDVPSAEFPCTNRRGTRHVRIEHYARGGHTDVWFVPPAG